MQGHQRFPGFKHKHQSCHHPQNTWPALEGRAYKSVDITFLDVYKAVEPIEDGTLFHFHENPNPACPVGRNIHALLDGKLQSIQEAMEDRMKEYTLEDIRNGIGEIIGEKV